MFYAGAILKDGFTSVHRFKTRREQEDWVLGKNGWQRHARRNRKFLYADQPVVRRAKKIGKPLSYDWSELDVTHKSKIEYWKIESKNGSK